MSEKKEKPEELQDDKPTAENKKKETAGEKRSKALKGRLINPNGRPRKNNYGRIIDSEDAKRMKAKSMSMLALHVNNRTNKSNIDYENVRECAKRGLTCKQIALCNGFSLGSYYNWIKEDPKFKEAVEEGRQEGIAVIVNRLYEKAENGDLSSIIFFLKNRAPERWRDGRDLNVQATANKTTSITEKSEAELLAIVNAGSEEKMSITPGPDSEPVEDQKGRNGVIIDAEYEITSP